MILNKLTPLVKSTVPAVRHLIHTSSVSNVKNYPKILSIPQNATHYQTRAALHVEAKSHSHDKLWKAERYLSLGLLAVLPAASFIHHPIMDYAVAMSLVVHVHWGVEAIVVDYVRPSIFGPTIPKISVMLVYLLSSFALGGLFMFNYTDIGLTQATRMLAKI